jgi:cytochrome oxidase Cu insertion factor (SCO1/SenC/PrrC family)
MIIEQKTKSRLYLLLIFAACALPIAASLFVYYVWQPAKLMNHGELMEVQPLPPGSFFDSNGKEVKLQSEGKWTLLVLDPGACADECKQRLYDVRQVWRAFELNQDRLQRVWAVSDATPPDTTLLKEHEGMQVVRASEALINSFPQPSVGRIYLIDAQGNQVLRYLPKPEPKRMIKDVSRLLLIKKM